MLNSLLRIKLQRKGASLIEYAVLVGFLSVSSVGTLLHLGGNVEGLYEHSIEKVALKTDSETKTPPAAPQTEEEHLDDSQDTPPAQPAPEEEKENQYFEFQKTTLNRWDGRTHVLSDYVDIKGIEGEPVPFFVSSSNGGNPVAVKHVVGQEKARSGEITWGTQLEVESPEMGETRVITLSAGNAVVGWTVHREPAPVPGAFDFGTMVLAWNDTRPRIHSGYKSIPNLENYSPFKVVSNDGKGNVVAESNVEGGTARAQGRIAHGTQLVADIPAPGETRTFTLSVADVAGTWVVKREPIPPRPEFRLTGNNNQSFAQINYSNIGVPNIPYSFQVSGTGNTNPYVQNPSSGTSTDGKSPSWGIQIYNTTPPRGVTETITLNIDGDILTWQVTGP